MGDRLRPDDAAARWRSPTCSFAGVGIWGIDVPGHVGLRDRQLRLVDRHRPRRHPDLGDPAAAEAGVADVDQPVRRGDDPLRRGLRRAVPAACTWAGPGSSTGCCPYPNTMGLWPQWRSPLVWDVFAVSTYATVSLLFWYVGLIPDLATLRDRAKNQLGAVSSTAFLAMGWRGSARHWHRYRTAYLLLAGLATPLVVSVHSVVSLRLHRRRSCPAGTRRSSRPTSSPGRSTPGSRWS